MTTSVRISFSHSFAILNRGISLLLGRELYFSYSGKKVNTKVHKSSTLGENTSPTRHHIHLSSGKAKEIRMRNAEGLEEFKPERTGYGGPLQKGV